jgi:chromosome segregation ATPase
MDFAVLLRPETIILAVLLALAGALIGFAVGKGLQTRRGEEALDAARKAHLRTLAGLDADHADTLAKLRDGHAGETSKLKQEYGRTMESLRANHASELKRVNDEHSALVERLNETNISNVREIRAEYEGQFASLRDQHETELRASREDMEQTVQMFRDEHARSTEVLRAAHEAGLQAIKLEFTESANVLKQEQEALRARQAEEHRREIEVWQKRRDEMEATEARLQAENHTLQETIRELSEGIKEARRNNAFSLSRSGDRLIRVIRSVQELASELEETSRTVTDGEYSFIGAIKDQSDRDTVLRLAGENRKDVDEEEPGAAAGNEQEAGPGEPDSAPHSQNGASKPAP